MLNNRKALKTAGIINAILIVAAFILGIIALIGADTVFLKINIILPLIALIFAFYYARFGYKKDAALYYKKFMLFYAATSLVNLIGNIIGTIRVNDTTYISTVLLGIAFICVVILAFAKDLKKNISTVLGIIILVIRVIIFIRSIINPSFTSVYKLQSILGLVLAMLACFFVITKYIDKDLRGTT